LFDNPLTTGNAMSAQELLESALKLEPAERFALADEILHSLDKPDPEIDRLWLEEAERRLAAFRRGEVKGIPAQQVIGNI
jgi:putative addiction module component (TIGR02574 family)